MAAAGTIIDELEQAMGRGPSDRQAETLRKVTELFLADAARYTETQVSLFDNVILRLSQAMETAVRRTLAERLAPIDNAPPGVLRSLARDEAIDVARPVLRQAARLDDAFLADVAETASQAHMEAIASRSRISETVTDVLVRRGNDRVALVVAANDGAAFSTSGYDRLVARARDDDVLAECVGLRKDVPAHLFRAILDSATDAVQKRLLSSIAARHRAEVRTALAGIAGRIATATGTERADRDKVLAEVTALHRRRALGEAEMRTYAEEGRFEETICALAVLCRVPPDMVERLFLGERPDPVLILARAAALSWATLQPMLKLRLNGPMAPAAAEQARESYDKLTASTAQRVLRFWQVRGQTARN